MTKKDYIGIAHSVATGSPAVDMPAEWRSGAASAQRQIAFALCDTLAADNPRFDRAKFLTACGIN